MEPQSSSGVKILQLSATSMAVSHSSLVATVSGSAVHVSPVQQVAFPQQISAIMLMDLPATGKVSTQTRLAAGMPKNTITSCVLHNAVFCRILAVVIGGERLLWDWNQT